LKCWKPLGFVIINSDLSHAYLGSNIVSIPKHLINIASPITEDSGEGQFIIHFTNYIDKAIVCHISGSVLNSLDGHLKLT
jgi:hypothetical protein